MTKRLKYTKDILTHMLNNNTNGNSKGPATASSQAFPSGSSTNMVSSRIGTITSATSTKRSEIAMAQTGMPARIASSQAILSSERKPLNVLNQIA